MSVNCLTSKDSLFNNLNAIFFTCLEVSHIVYFDVLKKLKYCPKMEIFIPNSYIFGIFRHPIYVIWFIGLSFILQLLEHNLINRACNAKSINQIQMIMQFPKTLFHLLQVHSTFRAGRRFI